MNEFEHDNGPNGTIGIAIGTNGITNGTIGKTLNDIDIPLVRLGNPELTQYFKLDTDVNRNTSASNIDAGTA